MNHNRIWIILLIFIVLGGLFIGLYFGLGTSIFSLESLKTSVDKVSMEKVTSFVSKAGKFIIYKIGIFLTVISVVMVIANFFLHKRFFYSQQFMSTLMEMIKIHEENVNNIEDHLSEMPLFLIENIPYLEGIPYNTGPGNKNQGLTWFKPSMLPQNQEEGLCAAKLGENRIFLMNLYRSMKAAATHAKEKKEFFKENTKMEPELKEKCLLDKIELTVLYHFQKYNSSINHYFRHIFNVLHLIHCSKFLSRERKIYFINKFLDLLSRSELLILLYFARLDQKINSCLGISEGPYTKHFCLLMLYLEPRWSIFNEDDFLSPTHRGDFLKNEDREYFCRNYCKDDKVKKLKKCAYGYGEKITKKDINKFKCRWQSIRKLKNNLLD